MDFGIGFGETLLIVVLVLIIFGSKQLPHILREVGKFVAMARLKSNEIMSEFNSVTNSLDKTADDPRIKKTEIRQKILKTRKEQSGIEILAKSGVIAKRVLENPIWNASNSVMIYSSMPDEVSTDFLIKTALAEKKRVSLPYLANENSSMDVSEYFGNEESLAVGTYGIMQVKTEDYKKFYKSDIDLIICPGIAFDRRGGRIGFGKGYYDNFLRDLRGRVKIVALAFDFQILDDNIPFSYSDIPMDIIFTDTETILPG